MVQVAKSMSQPACHVRRAHSKERRVTTRVSLAQLITLSMIRVPRNARHASKVPRRHLGALRAFVEKICLEKRAIVTAHRPHANQGCARLKVNVSVTKALQAMIVPFPFAAANNANQVNVMGALFSMQTDPFVRALLQNMGVLQDFLGTIAPKATRIGLTLRAEFLKILSNAIRALGGATAATAQQATTEIAVTGRANLAQHATNKATAARMENALASLDFEARIATSALMNTTAVIVRRTVIHGLHAGVVGAAAGAGNVFATKGMQGLTAVNVPMDCMGLNARDVARAARMVFARPTGLARASQASRATGVTPARRACSEMNVRWHAAGMIPATGTERATLQAYAYAKRGSRDRTVRYATQAEEDGAWSVSKSADGT